MSSKNYQNKSEEGQSLVEFALSIIIFLYLLAGIIDFGRLFVTWLSLKEAAEEGVLYGSICPQNQFIDARVRASSSSPVYLADADHVKVYISTIAQQGTELRVSVEYDDFHHTLPFMPQVQSVSAEAIGTVLTITGCP